MKKARRRINDEQGEEVLLVYEDNEVLIDVSEFIEIKSVNSNNTGKSYAYALIQFLRYMNSLGKTYSEINKKDIIRYYHYLAFERQGKVRQLKLRISKGTLRQYISIIGEFYNWLKEKYDDASFNSPKSTSITDKKFNKRNKYSFLFGQVLDAEQTFVTNIFPKLAEPPKTKHKKWYIQNEIDILSKSFKRRRDKVIFLITVWLGCRISEVLSIKEEDYNSVDQTIFIRESKTAQRYLYIPHELCEEIDAYMFTERAGVENEIGLLDYLFVNMKKGKSYGNKLSSHNYLEILKHYAEKVGFDPKEVITHAGRSTRAQALIEQQIFDSEAKLSDAMIMEMMGWSRITSITPYKQQSNLKIQRHVSERIIKRTRGNLNE